jgi:hypothetical protein
MTPLSGNPAVTPFVRVCHSYAVPARPFITRIAGEEIVPQGHPARTWLRSQKNEGEVFGSESVSLEGHLGWFSFRKAVILYLGIPEHYWIVMRVLFWNTQSLFDRR